MRVLKLTTDKCRGWGGQTVDILQVPGDKMGDLKVFILQEMNKDMEEDEQLTLKEFKEGPKTSMWGWKKDGDNLTFLGEEGDEYYIILRD